jgi:glycine cleavage system H lipoate-binding protein
MEDERAGYCSASLPDHPVHCSDTADMPCGNDQHRTCWLYLQRVYPEPLSAAARREPEFRIPAGTGLSPNHLWLQLHEDGTCRLGVDAFLARLLSPFDVVVPAPTGRAELPSVTLRVADRAVDLLFPNPVAVDAVNPALATRPGLPAQDPFGDGWLLAGRDPACGAHPGSGGAGDELIRGEEAVEWMRRETLRLDAFLRRYDATGKPEYSAFLQDGGRLVAGAAHRLDRGGFVQLCDAFLARGRRWQF